MGAAPSSPAKDSTPNTSAFLSFYTCSCFSSSEPSHEHPLEQYHNENPAEPQSATEPQPYVIPNFPFPEPKPRQSFHSVSRKSLQSYTRKSIDSKGRTRTTLKRRRTIGAGRDELPKLVQPASATLHVPQNYATIPQIGRISPMPDFSALENSEISDLYAASIWSRPTTRARDDDDDDDVGFWSESEEMPSLPASYYDLPDPGFVLGEVKSQDTLDARLGHQRSRSSLPPRPPAYEDRMHLRKPHGKSKSLSDRSSRSISSRRRTRTFSSPFNRASDVDSELEHEIRELKWLVESKRNSNIQGTPLSTSFRSVSSGAAVGSQSTPQGIVEGHVPAIAPSMRSTARREVLEDIGSALARPLELPHPLFTKEESVPEKGASLELDRRDSERPVSRGLSLRRVSGWFSRTSSRPSSRRSATTPSDEAREDVPPLPSSGFVPISQINHGASIGTSSIASADTRTSNALVPRALPNQVTLHSQSQPRASNSLHTSIASTPASAAASRFSTNTEGTNRGSDAWTSRTNISSFASRVSAMGIGTAVDGSYPSCTLSDYALR